MRSLLISMSLLPINAVALDLGVLDLVLSGTVVVQRVEIVSKSAADEDKTHHAGLHETTIMVCPI